MDRKWKDFIIIILMVTGIGFLLVIPLQDYLIQRNSSQYLSVSASEIADNQQALADYDYNQFEEATPWDVFKTFNEELPIIGQILIPELKLHLPILKGTAEANLLASAGTIIEDQVMGTGNYSLASHNMKNPELLFAPLHQAEKGMTIYITDMEDVYVYTIHTHKIIEPTQIEVLEDTIEPTLTLITCNYNGKKRLLTQASLTSKETFNELKNIDNSLTAE